MNTAKQINVMIGLLMVGMVGTLLYFLFDNGFDIAGVKFAGREDVAAQRQELVNAERGGFLYARNCRSCHGLTGQGAIERPGLPGAPLNDVGQRPPAILPALLGAHQDRLAATIHCGRIGTVMPPWSTQEGGPLNEFQIQQLVILITSEHFYEHGWEFAVEEGNHSDAFVPAKHLEEAIGEDDETIVLNNASLLIEDSFLRIGGDTIDEPYEVLQIVSFDEDTDEVEVLRGQMGSDPLAHESGAEVYNGPLPPPGDDALRTGEVGTPPCGQNAPSGGGGATAAEVALADVEEVDMQDNVFVIGGEENPTLTMAAGDSVTVPVLNAGAAIHNFVTTGPDGDYGTDDDITTGEGGVRGGEEGEITIEYEEAGTYGYQCDFHPTTMVGEIVVE